MGKKRVIQKADGALAGAKSQSASKLPKRKIDFGVLNILSSYNNTIATLTDREGNVILSSSCGAMGFKGARKGTPYAASKVLEFVAEQAKLIGLKEVGIKVKGIGSGRESAIRTFASKGFEIQFIRDLTPVPHNGPKPPKPRRV